MEDGVRVEIQIEGAGCPIAAAADDCGAVSSVDWVTPTGGGEVTEEVVVDGGAAFEDDGFERVYRSEEETVYRFKRDGDGDCPCSLVEDAGQPVRDVRPTDDGVVLSFFCRDVDTIRELIAELRTAYSRVSVRRLTRSSSDAPRRDLVYVDRDRLTDRQREVLETAHRMGYFEHPKEANATEVADELGIARTTFAEHLGAAQTKILDALLTG